MVESNRFDLTKWLIVMNNGWRQYIDTKFESTQLSHYTVFTQFLLNTPFLRNLLSTHKNKICWLIANALKPFVLDISKCHTTNISKGSASIRLFKKNLKKCGK